MNRILRAFQTLTEIHSVITRIEQIPAPSADANLQSKKSYLNEIGTLIRQIGDKTSALSETHIATQEIQDKFILPTQSKLSSEKPEDAAEFPALVAAGLTQIKELKTKAGKDYLGVIRDMAGNPDDPPPSEPPATENVQGKLLLVWKILALTADKTSVGQAIGNALSRGIITEKDVQRAFAGIDPNASVGDLFKTAIQEVRETKSLAISASPQSEAAAVVEALQALERLYIAVRDIRFVTVVIKASANNGNAPFIVELSGLQSQDPIGKTIADDAYLWDPDGDGEEGIGTAARGYIECSELKHTVITCTYKKPGTYQVRLQIQSADPSRVATGRSILPVTVQPSLSRISLIARIENTDISLPLREYVKDANGNNIPKDEDVFTVLSSEANAAGITFDASRSTDSSGAKLSRFLWEFGDGQALRTEEGNQQELSVVKHKYPGKPGRYRLKLEVTDSGGRKDRKFSTILIGSLAPRVKTDKKQGEPEDLFEFDGSLSRSDNGKISSYEWEVLTDVSGRLTNVITDAARVQIVGESKNKPTLKVKFKTAGIYQVKLKISDSVNSDTLTIDGIQVKSKKPRAHFTAHVCPETCPDATQPSLVALNASQSFDPDPTDKLFFKWELSSDVGDKLEPITDFDLIDGTVLEGKEQELGDKVKRLKVKFKRTGRFIIKLRVHDQHPEDLRQEDEFKQTITIASTVDAGWSAGSQSVVQLQEGSARFAFEAKALGAERAEVDFGVAGFSGTFADDDSDGIFKFENVYDAAGSYLVTAKFVSPKNGETVIQRRVVVGNADTPLAVIRTKIAGSEVIPEDAAAPEIGVIRNKEITFDASDSLNSLGKKENLDFVWDFGNGKKSRGNVARHAYTEKSPEGGYPVALTITETKGAEKPQATSKLMVTVAGATPTLTTLTLEKITTGQTTPIEVKLTAEGATDEDGKVVNYQFWYYISAESDRKIGVVDSIKNSATLKIDGMGEPDQKREYLFCVTLTDNENNRSECADLLPEAKRPKIEVTNGPNKSPTADFTIAPATAVKIGEEVTFSASAKDPDGSIKEYIWDVEGDGFHNDQPTDKATYTYIYKTKSSKSGISVKLKVTDDKGAAGYSPEKKVFVDSLSKAPTANFDFKIEPNSRKVKFLDRSEADAAVSDARITKWMWDFDTSQEIGCEGASKPHDFCNGDKADDLDSKDKNPIFEFVENGDYQVQLITEDNFGSVSRPVTKEITVRVFTEGRTTQDPNQPVSATIVGTSGQPLPGSYVGTTVSPTTYEGPATIAGTRGQPLPGSYVGTSVSPTTYEGPATIVGSRPRAPQTGSPTVESQPATRRPVTGEQLLNETYQQQQREQIRQASPSNQGRDQSNAARDVQPVLTASTPGIIMTTTPEGKKVLRIPPGSESVQVTLCWKDSKGDILDTWIDKNIYCDSDGLGSQDDDKDYAFTAADGGSKCWTTQYSSKHKTINSKIVERDGKQIRVTNGEYVARLSALGRYTDTPAKDEVEIIFSDSEAQPFPEMVYRSCESNAARRVPVLPSEPNQSLNIRAKGSIFDDLGIPTAVLGGVVGGAALILLIWGIAHIVKGGKIREQ